MVAEQLDIEFIKMVSDHSNLIYKVCNAYATGSYEMNDLYQDILLNMWRSYPSFRGDSKLSTWIYQVALHTAVSALRKQTKHRSHIQLTTELENILISEDSKSEQIKEMYSLIRRLDKYDRALILLWLDDLSYQEIADILGITRSNVATKINRVKNKLKEMSNS
ncbi:MAG: sigma-70 family RNA polymerase sigma factor [Paramuribaculum sp.]|nr:sigma-70 family RNA polymerase sigma factor [Paramuribaculum sp.]